MDEQEASTNNVKDPDDEFIEAVAGKVLEKLVKKGILTPCDGTGGTVRFHITRGMNRLSTANCRRRD